jgi:ribosomal protein S18 acetylase RimI-like enzyme
MTEEEDWKEELKNGTVYLIKSGDKVVGNLSYEQKSPEHLYISGLVVSPGFQGRGIARDVLTRFLNEHSKAKRIDLVTHPDNPALQLYQSLGFQVESRNEDYWGDGEPRLVLALIRNKVESDSKIFGLRKATNNDLQFLFKVSTDAMRPTIETLNPGKEFNQEEELAKYTDQFDPEKIEIIQYDGKDVGRLRVVRSQESIYVGGIQILPEFQGKGIGTRIFTDLMAESKQLDIPIVLEVHDVNEQAISFYKKLGFEEGEQVKDQTVMRYLPKDE